MPAHVKSTRVTVATREKTYSRREKVHFIFWFNESGQKKHAWIDDPGGIGWEIVREVVACPECARQRMKRNDAAAAG